MQLILNPVYIISVLLLLMVIAEWLARRKFFTHIGSALIAIILAALVANIGSSCA